MTNVYKKPEIIIASEAFEVYSQPVVPEVLP